MSEINQEVFEVPKVEKPKKKRKPMTPEAKQALIERLAKGREAKKLAKNQSKKSVKPNINIEVEPKVEAAPIPIPAAQIPKVTEPAAPLPDNSLEMKALQDQINSMKLEKLEALEKKNEKKKAAIEKRRATINRKAIERAQKNEVTKPAPIRRPVQKMEVIEEEPPQVKQPATRKMSLDDDLYANKKPRYSTFKRSVWSGL